MLYEVITLHFVFPVVKSATTKAAVSDSFINEWRQIVVDVITSYSIHYTKLYECFNRVHNFIKSYSFKIKIKSRFL